MPNNNFGDEVLKKFGLKFEDLNPFERETYYSLVDSVKVNELTIEGLREKVSAMRESVILEVSNYENGSKQDIYCKARIRNYTLMLGILSTPIKAQQALEQALRNVKK